MFHLLPMLFTAAVAAVCCSAWVANFYKRRETHRLSSSKPSDLSSKPSNLSLNDLDEALLMEVLYRLPSAKSAIICKSVCKRWYSLISTPYFVHSFNKYGESKFGYQKPYALVLNYQDPNRTRTLYVSIPSIDPGEFPFPCLPDERGHIYVVGSCNDLLLCWARVNDFRSLYICNPFTMQWQALPSIPWPVKDKLNSFRGHGDLGRGVLECAFVCGCEPRGDYTVGFGFEYRFSVMVLLMKDILRDNSEILEFGIYCSETGKWDKHILQGERFWLQSNIVPFNGKLHWYNGVNIVVYNPFNIGQEIVFIDVSELDLELQEFCHDRNVWFLGACRGFLRAMVFARKFYNDRHVSLLVFELKNYDAKKWSLKHKVCFGTMVSKTSWVQEYARHESYNKPKLLACHPTDENIVYLCFCRQVISCNLLEGELELDGNIPPGNHCGKLYTLEPSLWPTPVFA